MSRRTWWQKLTGFEAAPRARESAGRMQSVPAQIALLEPRQMLAAPAITNANSTQQVFDFAPIQPFSAMNIIDGDDEAMFARVTIDNGVNRGDFLPWTASGWQRSINGSDIVYTRSFAETENIGNVVQGAVRALDFQPRVNAIPGGMRELTKFGVFVYDQTATANNDQTLVQTISINDPPVVGGATPNQQIQDFWTVTPFWA